MSSLNPILFKNSGVNVAKKKSIFSSEPKEEVRPVKSEEEILEAIKKKAYDDAYKVGMADAEAEVSAMVENKELEVNELISSLNNEIIKTREVFISRNVEILKHVLNSLIGKHILVNDEIMMKMLSDALSELKEDNYRVAVSPSVNLSGDNIISDPDIADGCFKIVGQDKNIHVDLRTTLQDQLSAAIAILNNA